MGSSEFLGEIAVAVFMAIMFYRLPDSFITIFWGREYISRAHIRSQPIVCFRIIHLTFPNYQGVIHSRYVEWEELKFQNNYAHLWGESDVPQGFRIILPKVTCERHKGSGDLVAMSVRGYLKRKTDKQMT